MLASGPLMLKDGEYYDWSQCNANFIETKHPRSAICLTEEGKILFVTVDGRSPEMLSESTFRNWHICFMYWVEKMR